VFGLDGKVWIYDGQTGRRLWSSEPLGSGVGAEDGLLVADVDEDGRPEIFVNAGNLGIRLYEVRPVVLSAICGAAAAGAGAGLLLCAAAALKRRTTQRQGLPP
jgi:hypothetical protein